MSNSATYLPLPLSLSPSLPLSLFPLLQVMQIERERAVKWAKMTTQWKKYSDSDKLIRRVNKGIPNSVRGTVWRHVMGVENVKEEGVYRVWNGDVGMGFGK